MPKISFLIPFRSEEPERIRNRNWTADWIAAVHPSAEIVHAQDDGADPFSKTIAFNNAARAAHGDVFVLFDADCVPVESTRPWIARAANLIASGQAKWAKANRAHWLTPEASDAVRAQQPLRYLPVPAQDEVLGRGPISGLLTMLSRRSWENVRGNDPRFRGWGGEDDSWVTKLATLLGPPLRGGDVAHLYHQHLRPGGYVGRTFAEGGIPLWVGQTERNDELRRKYAQARNSKPAMRRLIMEYPFP